MVNENAKQRIIGALHEEYPHRVVEFADLGAMADNIIAALTSDGSITIVDPRSKCLCCGGVAEDHVANYYCPTFRPSPQPNH